MNNHTPGPWAKRPYGNNGFLVLSNHISLAHVRGIQGDEQVKANAKLISAAPDLLAACERAMGYLHTKYPKEADIFNELRQAIEKATL